MAAQGTEGNTDRQKVGKNTAKWKPYTHARTHEGGRRSSLARSDAQRGRKTAPPITTNGGTQAGTEPARSLPDLMNRHRPQRAAPGGEGRAKSLREAKSETVTQSHRNFR